MLSFDSMISLADINIVSYSDFMTIYNTYDASIIKEEIKKLYLDFKQSTMDSFLDSDARIDSLTSVDIEKNIDSFLPKFNTYRSKVRKNFKIMKD